MNRIRAIAPSPRLLAALIALGALPAAAQMNYREDYHIAQAQRILPSTGNTYSALDAGLLGSLRTARGEFRGALAYHNLLEPKVELRDNRGDYAIEGWMEVPVGWTSPGKLVRLHWEQYLREKRPASEGPDRESRFGVNAWEIELRPIPWAGIKLEKVRVAGLSSLGIIINPVFGKNGDANFLLEANMSHDKVNLPEFLVGEWEDQGRGAIYALSLGVGI